jgi:hypothetical protein
MDIKPEELLEYIEGSTETVGCSGFVTREEVEAQMERDLADSRDLDAAIKAWLEYEKELNKPIQKPVAKNSVSKIKEDPIIEYRGHYAAARWAHVSTFLKNLCFKYNLKINLDIDKGWLRESCRFVIIGKESLVDQVISEFNDAVEAYRNR